MNHTSMEERTKTQRRFGSAFVVWCIVLSAMSALSFYELREFFVWNKLPLANQYKPPMSIDELLDRRWQEKQEYKLYQQTGMKTLLPIRNELDYRLFRQINLEEYLYGQDDYLFSEGSIRAYYGDDCIGVQQVLTYAEKTKLVQDSLKKMGINLIVAFVPGKPTLLPEFLPRSVNRFKRKTTNYELFAAACSEKSLHYIDFTAFFKAYQLISDYPIFSRHGSHLSFYAECLVVDSTIRYIENLTGRDLPDFTRSTLRTQTIPKFRDQDIWLKAQRYCLNTSTSIRIAHFV